MRATRAPSTRRCEAGDFVTIDRDPLGEPIVAHQHSAAQPPARSRSNALSQNRANNLMRCPCRVQAENSGGSAALATRSRSAISGDFGLASRGGPVTIRLKERAPKGATTAVSRAVVGLARFVQQQSPACLLGQVLIAGGQGARRPALHRAPPRRIGPSRRTRPPACPRRPAVHN